MSVVTSPTAHVAAPTLPDAKFRLHVKSTKDQPESPVTGQVPAGEPTQGLFSSILQAAGIIAKL